MIIQTEGNPTAPQGCDSSFQRHIDMRSSTNQLLQNRLDGAVLALPKPQTSSSISDNQAMTPEISQSPLPSFAILTDVNVPQEMILPTRLISTFFAGEGLARKQVFVNSALVADQILHHL
jgi:hypothetical protein